MSNSRKLFSKFVELGAYYRKTATTNEDHF